MTNLADLFLIVLEMLKLNYAAMNAEAGSGMTIWSFIRSQRGAPLIVHDGFVYRCERKIESRTYWLCIRYKGHKCNARLILTGNRVHKATDHNHMKDDRSNETEIELKDLNDADVETWLKGKHADVKLE